MSWKQNKIYRTVGQVKLNGTSAANGSVRNDDLFSEHFYVYTIIVYVS